MYTNVKVHARPLFATNGKVVRRRNLFSGLIRPRQPVDEDTKGYIICILRTSRSLCIDYTHVKRWRRNVRATHSCRAYSDDRNNMHVEVVECNGEYLYNTSTQTNIHTHTHT